MKQAKIIKAFTTTEALAENENLTPAGKWALYYVRKQLSAHNDFFNEEIAKLFDKYPAEYDREHGLLNFKSAKARDAFTEASKALDDVEVELNIAKQKAKIEDIPGITVKQMEALEDFIDFAPDAPVEP